MALHRLALAAFATGSGRALPQAPIRPAPGALFLGNLGFLTAFATVQSIAHSIRAGRDRSQRHTGRHHIHHMTSGSWGCAHRLRLERSAGPRQRPRPSLGLAGLGHRLWHGLSAHPRRVRPLAQPSGRLLDERGPREHRCSCDIRLTSTSRADEPRSSSRGDAYRQRTPGRTRLLRRESDELRAGPSQRRPGHEREDPGEALQVRRDGVRDLLRAGSDAKLLQLQDVARHHDAHQLRRDELDADNSGCPAEYIDACAHFNRDHVLDERPEQVDLGAGQDRPQRGDERHRLSRSPTAATN